LLAVFAVGGGLYGCSDAGDLLDLAFNPPGRKPIDRSKVGVNNFFVDREFGSIEGQYDDIRSNLGVPFVRVLLAWTDAVQPSPNAQPDYNFFDNILNRIPPGVEVLVVVSHTPSWMESSANWIDGDPRKTWIERWLTPTVARYGRLGGIVGFEVWNEPDRTLFESDRALELENADMYFQLLQMGSVAIHRNAPGKLVVNAATQSIQQDFPNRLRYNRRLRDLGAEGLIDVWNIHYYSSSFESVVTSNGVAEPIWVTESGEQGPTEQLAYVETTWPFLLEEIPGIQRFYYYQYGETVTPVDNNFGLRTTDSSFPVSDLYLFLSNGRAPIS
jgi:hypothetical protein